MKINVIEEMQPLNEVNYELGGSIKSSVGPDGTFQADENELIKILDKTAQANMTALALDIEPSDLTNLLFVSLSGLGKTGIVKSWADKHKFNLVTQQMGAFQKITLGGIPTVKLPKPDSKHEISKELAEADPDNPNYYYMASVDTWYDLSNDDGDYWSVLYLDELNMADTEAQALIQTLVNDHEIYDAAKKNHKRVLPYYLMTIATVNPPSVTNANGSTERYAVKDIGTALKARFAIYTFSYSKKDALDYILKYLDKTSKLAETSNRIKDENREAIIQKFENAKVIAKKLLTSPEFLWWSADSEISGRDADTGGTYKYGVSSNKVEPRAITKCLIGFDGTVEDFVKMWSTQCSQSSAPKVRNILQGVQLDDPKLIDAQKKAAASNVAKSNQALAGFGVSGGMFNTPQMKIQNAFKQIKNS